MMKQLIGASVAALIASVATANAAPVTATFDSALDGTPNVDGQAVNTLDLFTGYTVTVTTDSNGSVDQAVLFDTNNLNSRDNDLEDDIFDRSDFVDNGNSTAGLTPIDAGLVMIIQENANVDANGVFTAPDDEGRGGTITFTFPTVSPFSVDLFSIDFIDTVAGVTATVTNAAGSQTFTMGMSLDTSSTPNFTETLLFGAGVTGVTELVIDFGRDSGAINNLVFEVSGDDVAVPLPGAILFMLTGAAGLTAARRKRAA